MTYEFAHHYHLGKSIVIFRGIRCDFELLFIHFFDEIPLNFARDGTPHCAASHLGYSVFLCPITRTHGLYCELSFWQNFHVLSTKSEDKEF